MRLKHHFSALIVLATALTVPGAAQMVNGPPQGGIPTFSPVTGAQPFASGMSAQQMQMAQMYMLYGMMGMGRGNVTSGNPNPFVNGGFGMGSLPSLEAPADYGAANSKNRSQANREELRAQRAEQKRQAKLAKSNAAAAKAAGKAKGKKNAAGAQ